MEIDNYDKADIIQGALKNYKFNLIQLKLIKDRIETDDIGHSEGCAGISIIHREDSGILPIRATDFDLKISVKIIDHTIIMIYNEMAELTEQFDEL